jgi:hypothetical protein
VTVYHVSGECDDQSRCRGAGWTMTRLWWNN